MAGHVPKKCQPCNGTGVLVRTHGWSAWSGHAGKTQCPQCRGTGREKRR